jgi:hypothetical protein
MDAVTESLYTREREGTREANMAEVRTSVVPAVSVEHTSKGVDLVGRVVIKVTMRRECSAEIEFDLSCRSRRDTFLCFQETLVVPDTQRGRFQ